MFGILFRLGGIAVYFYWRSVVTRTLRATSDAKVYEGTLRNVY